MRVGALWGLEEELSVAVQSPGVRLGSWNQGRKWVGVPEEESASEHP